MITLSLGSLGDMIIQSALLRKIDHRENTLAVPETFAAVARELFPKISVLELDRRSSDARILATKSIDHDQIARYLTTEFATRYPDEPLVPLSLTVEAIHKRHENIYKVYFDLFKKNPLLACYLETDRFETLHDKPWRPLDFLPQWSGEKTSGIVYLCPVGGIGVKSLGSDKTEAIIAFLRKQGIESRIIATKRDPEALLRGRHEHVVTLLPEEECLTQAASLFSRARSVIAVDTAWYHLAALQGVPTLAIPGPRSLGHFETPGLKFFQSPKTRLACIDCFSSDACSVTAQSHCQAQPTIEEIIRHIAIALSLPLPESKPLIGRAAFGRATWKQPLFRRIVIPLIEAAKNYLLVPLLGSMFKRVLYAIRDGLK